MKDGSTKELTNDGYDGGILRGKEPVSVSLSKGLGVGNMNARMDRSVRFANKRQGSQQKLSL